MTASDIIIALIAGDPCPNWVSRTAIKVDPPTVYPGQVARFYETTGVVFFPEVTVRIPLAGTTRRGKPALQRRRMDLVGVIQPHFKNFQPFVVGVEVKVSGHDLRNDEKLQAYLDYCHAFFLAVPEDMERLAQEKISFTPGLDCCGLLTVSDDGQVEYAKAPQIRYPTLECLAALYAELLIRPFKRAKNQCKTFIEFERRG